MALTINMNTIKSLANYIRRIFNIDLFRNKTPYKKDVIMFTFLDLFSHDLSLCITSNIILLLVIKYYIIYYYIITFYKRFSLF